MAVIEYNGFAALDLLFSMTRHPPSDEFTREPDDETALAIEARGLTKRFGDHTAVDHPDLAIPQGHVYRSLGPNGAGKTTPMRMLTTLISPTAGTTTTLGTPFTDRESDSHHIGYLSEEPPVYEELRDVSNSRTSPFSTVSPMTPLLTESKSSLPV
jgi:ABC-type phosphate/phosphonate transport system ATPase subunit